MAQLGRVLIYLEFMCCDATRCLPPTEADFEFALTAVGATEAAKEEEVIASQAETETQTETQPATTEPAVATPKLENNTPKIVLAPTKPVEKAEKVEEATKEISTNLSANTTTETAPDRTQGGILNPATWSGEVEKVSDTEYKLTFKADLQEGWYRRNWEIEKSTRTSIWPRHHGNEICW